ERYRFEVPTCGVIFEADRLRRDHNELIGELTVRCDLPGVQSVNGCLNVADFNFSSLRARQAERQGSPAMDLRTVARPERDDIDIEGFVFPRRHPFCSGTVAQRRATPGYISPGSSHCEG